MLKRIYSKKHPNALFLMEGKEFVFKVYDKTNEMAAACSVIDDVLQFVEFAANWSTDSNDVVRSRAILLQQQILWTQVEIGRCR